MQKAPLVSAVIITYNQEKYIAQTIDCVLSQQTEYDFEIVIGEDCSTDRTREIVYDYQQRHPDKIRVITSDRNVGLMENFYRSVKSARGKYVAACGGDDYWHCPEKLHRQVTFLEEHPEYGLVHSDENVLYDESGEIVNGYNSKAGYSYTNKSENTLALLLSGRYRIVASSVLFKKRFFDENFDFDELHSNGVIIEDMPLYLMIAAHSKMCYMSESLVTRRVVKGSITRQGFENKMQLWQSVYKCYLLFYSKYKDKLTQTSIDERAIHGLMNTLMFRTAVASNRKEFVRYHYHVIKTLSDSTYLGINIRTQFYISFLPFGITIYNYTISVYRWFREIFFKIPRKGV